MPKVTGLAAALLLAAGCGGDATSSTDDTPARLLVFAGDTQYAAVAMPVRVQPTVEVQNAAGRPLPGVTVRFEVTEGDGWTTTADATTDAAGHAGTTWYLGPAPGSAHRLAVTLTAGGTSASFRATALPLEPDSTYLGRNSYIELTAGSLPLVLSAPHGGTLAPAELPDRTSGETVRDENTLELARTIADTVRQRTGKRPHLVVSRLSRTKLDPNRDVGEATEGNALAGIAWHEWHGFLEAAREAVERAGGGLYIDLHGHGHASGRAELGYLLSANELALTDAQLNSAALVARSSVRALAGRTTGGLASLLRGPYALGTLLQARGYPAVPSQAQPHPASDPYFTGGYDTARHGSQAGGHVDGIQLELQRPGVRDTEANRAAFAGALLAALQEYFTAHYGRELR